MVSGAFQQEPPSDTAIMMGTSQFLTQGTENPGTNSAPPIVFMLKYSGNHFNRTEKISASYTLFKRLKSIALVTEKEQNDNEL